ncbi:MAG TPA: transporter substrate-binding domain-containing protein [Acidocella sp.]|nr:transporter substrate-binding domain-containing protein [Acidocella sp.]
MTVSLVKRRNFLAGAAAGAAAFTLPGLAKAASLADIKTRGVLNVATEDDYQPFEFFKDNVLTGFDVELLKLLEPNLPFKINDEVVPWTGILPGVVTGKYDMAVTAILVTKERMASLDFMSPVAQSVDYYLKRADDKRINSVKDLSGLKLGVEAGSAMLAQLPQLDAMLKETGGSLGPVQQYQGYPEAYQDLALGRLDYVVNTQLSLYSVLTARPGVFAVGQAVSAPSYIAWATQKGNTELCDLFNKLLLAARADGSMYKLQQKWFSTTFESMPEQPTAS